MFALAVQMEYAVTNVHIKLAAWWITPYPDCCHGRSLTHDVCDVSPRFEVVRKTKEAVYIR